MSCAGHHFRTVKTQKNCVISTKFSSIVDIVKNCETGLTHLMVKMAKGGSLVWTQVLLLYVKICGIFGVHFSSCQGTAILIKTY